MQTQESGERTKDLPLVVLLATGGTIAGQGESGRSTHYASGQLSAAALLAAVPGLADIARVEAVQVCNVNSDDISGTIWLELARIIRERAADPEVCGFVITHGTDTLEETAWFLELTTATDKPVVLTGSMRPATSLSADGAMNLFAAVATAIDPQSRGRGALTVFADRIYNARQVRKSNTASLDAFSPGEAGCVGYVKDRWVSFRPDALRCRSARRIFDLEGVTALPPVEIVYFSVDADPALLLHAASLARGIVLAGAGGGEYSRGFMAAVAELARQSYPVVRASRVAEGLVLPDEAWDAPGNIILSGDLSPHKAKILLRLALTVSQDIGQLRELFTSA